MPPVLGPYPEAILIQDGRRDMDKPPNALLVGAEIAAEMLQCMEALMDGRRLLTNGPLR
jgi:hypothetical protein